MKTTGSRGVTVSLPDGYVKPSLNVIPPRPKGSSWDCPDRDNIRVTDDAAFMTIEDFEKLIGWCGSFYRWPYVGKMVKVQIKGYWNICWCSQSVDPEYIDYNYRVIVIVDDQTKERKKAVTDYPFNLSPVFI